MKVNKRWQRWEKWSEEETEILVSMYEKIGSVKLQELLPNRSESSIADKAKRMGFEKNKVKLSSMARFDNHDYFSVPNIENSYWAGLIAADGNIHPSRPLIALYQSDKKVIDSFAKSIKYNGKIYTRERKNTTENSIQIFSEKIINDLYLNYNIVPNKSLILKPPTNLNHENSLAFITGLLDGDGSISILKRRSKIPGKNSGEYIVFMILGTEAVLNWIASVTFPDLSVCKRSDANVYKLSGSYNKALKFLNLLYSIKELDGIRFDRKWDKLKYYKEKYEN